MPTAPSGLKRPLLLRTDAELEMGASVMDELEALCRIKTAPSDAEEGLVQEAADAELIFTCYAPISAAVIAAAPHLRGIVKYGVGVDSIDLKAAAGGHVSVIETEALGRAAMLIGAGRRTVDDVIDPAAGLVIHKKLGDEVTKSEPLLTFHYNDDTNLEEASELVANAYQITDTPPASRDLVHSVLTTKRKT